jgi:hypothetical protein
MNLEHHVQLPTIRKIYEHYESKERGYKSRRLGASQIGNECERALWYGFRHAYSQKFEGRMLRLFETGHREEERIVRNLRDIGVTVWDRDESTGGQITFTAHGDHFVAMCDGIGKGFHESSQEHILEFKTLGKKAFTKLKKEGLQKANPVYWAQVQIEMHLSDIQRAFFIAIEKDTDEIYGERVKYDAAEGIKLLAKAESIIFRDDPPNKLSNDPSFFKCKFCPYWNICHGDKLPEVNCRTCAHATPERAGGWSCARQKEFGKVCEDHLFNPTMMPWQVYDAGETWVEYQSDDGEIVRNERNSGELVG